MEWCKGIAKGQPVRYTDFAWILGLRIWPKTITFYLLIRISTKSHQSMKKIDILNFITDFRKSPNDFKTYGQLVSHLGTQHEPSIQAMLNELKQLGVVKETEQQGEKAYQVARK